MEKQNAHAIKFQINLDWELGNTQETIYLSDEAFENLPSDSEWGIKNAEAVIPEYFTKEKIEEYKRKFCERIMNSDNPFSIYEDDSDYYPIEKDKIWK